MARQHLNQPEWLSDERFGNLRASQAWLASQKSEEAIHLLIEYVKVLAPSLRQRNFDVDLLRWCEDALQEGEDALHHLSRSLVMRRRLRNKHGAASSLRRLAFAHLKLRQFRTAVRYLWQSLSAYHQLGMLSRSRFLRIIGEFLHWMGR